MAKQSVIVLQDNFEAMQDVISIIGKISSFEVIGTSCDGAEGLELVKKLNPDFLILGIVLKNLDGVAVMEYEIDFSGKSEAEIKLISAYLKYIEYLSKWDGTLPTVMAGDSASIMIPVEPEA